MPVMPTSAVLPVLLVAVTTLPALGSASLRPEAVAGWNAYVAATERRIAHELASRATDRFLAQDFLPSAAQRRREVLSGAIVMEEVPSPDGRGTTVEIESARVHHWRGAVFIPRARLGAVLDRLEAEVPPHEDVLRSEVLDRGPDWMRVYLRLRRTKIVTAVYNTEHLVTFARRGPTRASSTSASTRIAEVEDPGTPAERELLPGEDRGFLWKLNAYWRYEEVPGGVIASASQSRSAATCRSSSASSPARSPAASHASRWSGP